MKNGMLSAKLFDSRIHSQNVTGKEMYLLIRNERALLIYSGYGKIDLRQLRTIKRKQIAKRWQIRMDSARFSLHRAHEVRLPGKGCQPEPLRGMVCPGNSVSFFGFVLTIAYKCVIISVVVLCDNAIYH